MGLIAEDVEKVNPDLVVRDKEGKPYTRALRSGERDVAQRVSQRASQSAGTRSYDRAAEKFRSNAVLSKREIDELDRRQIQKVSAQLEASKPAPQVVNNP